MVEPQQLYRRIKALRRVANALHNECKELDKMGLYGYADELTEIHSKIHSLVILLREQRQVLM